MGALEALHDLFKILVLHRSKCYEPGLPRGRGRGTLWFVGVTRTTVETPCGAGGIKGPASLHSCNAVNALYLDEPQVQC